VGGGARLLYYSLWRVCWFMCVGFERISRYDEKFNVKSQINMYCYEGGNKFKSRMIHQGTLHIIVDPNRHIGHKHISKLTIDLMKLTGFPSPRKGKPGNNSLR
jgi:hypothetical protein